MPPFCRQCGFPYESLEGIAEPFICANCADRRWYFQWARAAYPSEGEVLHATIGFKYRQEYYRLGQLTDWLVEAFDHHAVAQTWDALVPVPLHPRRHRARGFNHAEEIARALGKRRKMPVWDCLYRYRETATQARLERNARWKNMRDAFTLKHRFDVKRRNLLLIDDVFTTGATSNACAQVLAEAGAGNVAILTVCRS